MMSSLGNVDQWIHIQNTLPHPPVHFPEPTFLEDVCGHMKEKHLPSGKEAHTKQWLCPLVSQAVYRGFLTMAIYIYIYMYQLGQWA